MQADRRRMTASNVGRVFIFLLIQQASLSILKAFI